VEIYKAFKELAEKHEYLKLVNNDGVIELHDQRFPYNPIMMIGKGAVFYDPNDSKTVLEILKNKTR
jgi:CTP:phosphocholine cytidylyltransferase-like protein